MCRIKKIVYQNIKEVYFTRNNLAEFAIKYLKIFWEESFRLKGRVSE